MIYSRDTPFWSETLDMLITFCSHPKTHTSAITKKQQNCDVDIWMLSRYWSYTHTHTHTKTHARFYITNCRNTLTQTRKHLHEIPENKNVCACTHTHMHAHTYTNTFILLTVVTTCPIHTSPWTTEATYIHTQIYIHTSIYCPLSQ